MVTEELLNEFAYAMKSAEVLIQELREARSLLTFALDAKKIEATNRALLYFILSDSGAKNDILHVAKIRQDKDVMKLVKEYETSVNEENNKLAREITMREFNVKPLIENEHGQKINELPLGNTSNGTVEAKEEKWKTFEEDFNRQWKNF